MKILFIAITESIHASRWIKQISDQGWEICLYPSREGQYLHKSFLSLNISHPKIFVLDKSVYSGLFFKIYYKILKLIRSDFHERRLYHYIRKTKPDIIHTLETQGAGYLLLSVKKKWFEGKPFPIWWHTNWGSDIYLFGRLKNHKDKIREVLSLCDYYSCECERDVKLAADFGFNKITMPVYPNSGGLDIDDLTIKKQNSLQPSSRKIIMLKGYQGWAGRAFVGLRALSMIKEHLENYTLVIYSCEGYQVEIAAELFEADTGIKVIIVPIDTKHDDILNFHGKARISIGLSISDAISTSVLEAMTMGSFPIQSWTSAADEWFEDGISGLLVPPEDPDKVAIAILKALKDDDLVDKASAINWETVKTRLDYNDLKNKTINSYKTIMVNKTTL